MNEIARLRERHAAVDFPEETPGIGEIRSIPDLYGKNIFSLKVMRNYLSETAFKSLSTTIKEGGRLDPSMADEVADAMKTWAVSIIYKPL